MERFTDKVVIVTGAGSGLGRAAAQRLATEGADLVLVDLDGVTLGETAQLVADLASGGGPHRDRRRVRARRGAALRRRHG